MSPCCRATIHKFGDKRRQCSFCKKTWTVWAKKRGRNPLRPHHNLLKKVVVEKQSLLSPVFNRRGLTIAAMSYRLRQTMKKYLDRSLAKAVPAGQLILVIDALWFVFKKQRWTLYLAAVRVIGRDRAALLEPVLAPSKENYEGWAGAISSWPLSVKNRIVALVCDGFRGTDRLAADNGWIIQRCHFHLLSRLQARRGQWKQLPDWPQREQVYLAVRKLLLVKNNVPYYQRRLLNLLVKSGCPRKMAAIGREFLRRLDNFRAYLNYPELRLPSTTNSIESLNRIIRAHCRHLRTPESLLLRAKVLIRMRKTIACKPKIYQQN